MASLAPKSLVLATERPGEKYYPDFIKREEAELAKLQAISDKLPAGQIVGKLVRFPYADGYALYLVTKEKPLTLQHIAFGDAWQIPYAHIRGLRRQDIDTRTRLFA